MLNLHANVIQWFEMSRVTIFEQQEVETFGRFNDVAELAGLQFAERVGQGFVHHGQIFPTGFAAVLPQGAFGITPRQLLERSAARNLRKNFLRALAGGGILIGRSLFQKKSCAS